MRFIRSYIAAPNRMIDNTDLHYTSKIVYCTLAFMQQRNGRAKLTIARIVELSGLCENTVLQALAELESHGFISRKRNWRWSKEFNAPIYAANSYKISRNLVGGYTLLSASIMDIQTTPAGFAVLIFLYRCAGRNGRAFPSVRYIAGAWREKTGRGLDMSKSTVQRVLKQLATAQAFLVNPCECDVGDKSCNSYYLANMVSCEIPTKSARIGKQNYISDFFAIGGVPIFEEASTSNKITKDYTNRKEKNGVAQFVDFAKNQLFYYDGTGVLVSVTEEQFELLWA